MKALHPKPVLARLIEMHECFSKEWSLSCAKDLSLECQRKAPRYESRMEARMKRGYEIARPTGFMIGNLSYYELLRPIKVTSLALFPMGCCSFFVCCYSSKERCARCLRFIVTLSSPLCEGVSALQGRALLLFLLSSTALT